MPILQNCLLSKWAHVPGNFRSKWIASFGLILKLNGDKNGARDRVIAENNKAKNQLTKANCY